MRTSDEICKWQFFCHKISWIVKLTMVPQWGVAGWQQAGVTRILTMRLFILIVINTLTIKVSTVFRGTQYSEKEGTCSPGDTFGKDICWLEIWMIFAGRISFRWRWHLHNKTPRCSWATLVSTVCMLRHRVGQQCVHQPSQQATATTTMWRTMSCSLHCNL